MHSFAVIDSENNMRPEESPGGRGFQDLASGQVRPHFQQRPEQIAALYRQLVGTGRKTNDLKQIVRSAMQGQIQYLFVVQGEERWGTVDPTGQRVEVHEARKPGDEELLQLAVRHTRQHRGIVYSVKPEESPDAAGAAAIFWLPLGDNIFSRLF